VTKALPLKLASMTAVVAAFAGVCVTSFADDQPADPTPAAETGSPGTAPAANPGVADGAAAEPAPGLAEGEALITELQRLSYALGYVTGRQMQMRDIEVDPQVFARGLTTGMTGEEGALTDQQIQETLTRLDQQMQMRQMQRFHEQAQRGQAFLEENRQREGVEVTESGLQFEVVEAGDGESPGPQDLVRVHYRGTLTDGTQFDSSYDRGEPAEFRVNEVIAGWTEALQKMRPGATFRLVIPPNLAYGERSPSPLIPPNAVLVFDVELLDVVR
jgi:FKBP-type peptidyl-prolyl cis-trans isomerase FklB